MLPASCLHLGRKGSSKHPSHTTGSGSQAVPTTSSLRGSPGPLQMAPVHPAGGSPSTRRGPRRHRSQHRELSRATMVLSCSSPAAVGNGTASTGIFLFLPSPFPSPESLPKCFVPGSSQQTGSAPQGEVKPQLGSASDARGRLLPGSAWRGRAERDSRGVQGWPGAHGDSEHSWSSSSRAVPLLFASLACVSRGAALLQHREREGLVNRIRSPAAFPWCNLVLFFCSHALCSSKTCWKHSGHRSSPLRHPRQEPGAVAGAGWAPLSLLVQP